jgi:sulfofructose kinase
MTSAEAIPRPFDVIGLGVNTLDLIATIDGYPQPDTKAPMYDFDVQGGGVVATAMVACARLALRTRYVGKVGTDFWSRASLRTLSSEGIDVRHVLKAKGSPGQVSIVFADRTTGQRTLFYRRPPGYTILPEELDRAVLTAGHLLHVDGIDTAAAAQAVEWARAAGMRITMDADRALPGVEQVWPRVDLLVCTPRFLGAVSQAVGLDAGLRDLADRGPARVAVTLAAEGVQGVTGGRVVRIAGFPITPVDTNGAGDVFHGACAVGELRNWPLDWTLIFASAVAAMKCRSLGGRRGIPRCAAVAEFLASHGYKEIALALDTGSVDGPPAAFSVPTIGDTVRLRTKENPDARRSGPVVGSQGIRLPSGQGEP